VNGVCPSLGGQQCSIGRRDNYTDKLTDDTVFVGSLGAFEVSKLGYRCALLHRMTGTLRSLAGMGRFQ
jgi:hypothetical protein